MHDRNGTLIEVGDVVIIKARVTNVTGGADYCNATLAVGFEKEHGPDNVTSSLTVNTRQTLLVEKAAS